MQSKIFNIVLLLFLSFSAQACSAFVETSADKSAPKASTTSNSETTTTTTTTKVEKTTASSSVVASAKTEAKTELKAGDSIASSVATVKVKDAKLKIKSFKSIVNNKDTVMVLVKPGCIFCESLLAVMDSLHPKIRPQVLFVLDAAHASPKEFQDKAKKHSRLKGLWIYDYENRFHDSLGLNSFPRIMQIDAQQKVLAHQIGLKLPENPETLKTQPFPVVLQTLSQNTITWMSSL